MGWEEGDWGRGVFVGGGCDFLCFSVVSVKTENEKHWMDFYYFFKIILGVF